MENNIPAVVPEYHSKNFVVRGLFNKRLEKAAEYTALVNPSYLIDIGCGDGAFIEVLQKLGPQPVSIWGIDLNKNVMDLKYKYPLWFFKRESILKTEFSEGRFDLAVCLDTLEHIKEIERAVAEIRRITSPQGWLITRQPTETAFYKFCRYLLKGTFSSSGGPAAGVHWHSAAAVDRLVRAGGYRLVKHSKLPILPPFDLFHVNLYRKGDSN